MQQDLATAWLLSVLVTTVLFVVGIPTSGPDKLTRHADIVREFAPLALRNFLSNPAAEYRGHSVQLDSVFDSDRRVRISGTTVEQYRRDSRVALPRLKFFKFRVVESANPSTVDNVSANTTDPLSVRDEMIPKERRAVRQFAENFGITNF
jgi:hypothetical protein